MTAAATQVITLHPGDIGVGTRGDRLETLLGSCVAIVLTDPRRTVGAMCHIVHSRRGGCGDGADAGCGEVALRSMAHLLQGHGITPRLCEAYVFGGGNMFPHLDEAVSVGDDNVDWALHALAALGVRVLSVDVRGNVYRRLRWTVGPDAPEVTAVPL